MRRSLTAELLSLADATRNSYLICAAYHGAGALYVVQGEWAKARSMVDHLIGVAQAGSVHLMRAVAVPIMAYILARLGETKETLDRVREGEELLNRVMASGMLFDLAGGFRYLSLACILLGELPDARRFAARAVEWSGDNDAVKQWTLHTLGDIAGHPDCFDFVTAESQYRERLSQSPRAGAFCGPVPRGLGTLRTRKPGGQRAPGAQMMFTRCALWIAQTEEALRSLGT
jgi:hypothetical protein